MTDFGSSLDSILYKFIIKKIKKNIFKAKESSKSGTKIRGLSQL